MTGSLFPESVPETLRQRERWLLWDESAETPRRPHWKGDFQISWSDSDAWHTFEEAVTAAQEQDSWGIGYVFTPECDHYAVDIDGPFTDSGEPRDWFPGIEPFAGTYIEQSPSGNGLHAIVTGEPPEWWSDCEVSPELHQGVDVLENKFCTITGDVIDASGDAVESVNPDSWFTQVYHQIRGELPSLSNTGSSDTEPDSDLSEQQVKDALSHIDPDLSHTEWVRIGYAVHAWDSSSTGRRVFEEWSQGGSKWDKSAERIVGWIWDNADDNGGVSVGTLIHEAKAGGWTFSKATDGGTAAVQGGSSTSPTNENNDANEWGLIRTQYETADDSDDKSAARYDAAELLMQRHEWRNLEENDTLYWYDDAKGIYRSNGESQVRTFARQGLRGQFARNEVREFLSHLRAARTVPQEDMGGPDGLVATKNGVLDVEQANLRDHSPEYNFLSRLGTRYDPTAECPRFKQFLNEVLSNDTARKKLQEFAGYTLMHWRLPHHKALFIVGPQNSGKSTFADTIRALHGEDTVASLSPQEMTQRFGGAELYDKWVNIRNDIPAEMIQNTGTFKEIVAGDPIKAEKKRKDPFMFKPQAKHIFAANQLPDTENDDAAFYRRILLVPFPHTVPRDQRDKDLDHKLESELPGILNWALEGLERLREQGGFTGDLDPSRTAEKWDKWGHTADRFASACLKIGTAGNMDPLPKTKVYEAYQKFCADESMPCDMQQAMTRRLKTEHGATDGKATVDGTQERCFLNLEFTSGGERYLDDGPDAPGGFGSFD